MKHPRLHLLVRVGKDVSRRKARWRICALHVMSQKTNLARNPRVRFALAVLAYQDFASFLRLISRGVCNAKVVFHLLQHTVHSSVGFKGNMLPPPLLDCLFGVHADLGGISHRNSKEAAGKAFERARATAAAAEGDGGENLARLRGAGRRANLV